MEGYFPEKNYIGVLKFQKMAAPSTCEFVYNGSLTNCCWYVLDYTQNLATVAGDEVAYKGEEVFYNFYLKHLFPIWYTATGKLLITIHLSTLLFP
jgi:hypothetical protein